jgi:predicted transcriptional regulator
LTKRENILISVEHRHAVRILSGTKKVELRRRPFHISLGTHVWIYSKAPHAAVRVVATVGKMVSDSPERLWEKCGRMAGISRSEFNDYFSGSTVGWAIFLEQVHALPRAVTLNALRRGSALFHPPQFFMRLHHGSRALDLLTESLRTADSDSDRNARG